MYSSRAAALTPQLSCRSTGPWFRHMVHHPGSETTVTDDDQSSKHNQYTTRRDNRSWLDLSLEIPTLLLGRAAVAGHICSSVQASFSGAADICGTARRVAKHYRGWAARGHSIEIQRHVQGEGGSYSFESRRSHARVGLGCMREVNCYRAFHSTNQAQDHNSLLKSMHMQRGQRH